LEQALLSPAEKVFHAFSAILIIVALLVAVLGLIPLVSVISSIFLLLFYSLSNFYPKQLPIPAIVQ